MIHGTVVTSDAITIKIICEFRRQKQAECRKLNSLLHNIKFSFSDELFRIGHENPLNLRIKDDSLLLG